VSDLDAAYSSFAADHGLEAVPGFTAGLLTPLLVESGSGQLAPAASGALGDGVEGVIGHLSYTRNKTFRFSVALTEIPASTAFVPRLSASAAAAALATTSSTASRPGTPNSGPRARS
jgi:hypothetical protein